MTTDELRGLYEAHHKDEFLKFDRVQPRPHPRRDLSAFILLDQLCPMPGRDMITSAAHDQFWVDPVLSDLAVAGCTEEQLVTLIRCGIILDEDDNLFFFT
jgi:hypothetical protein